MMLLLSLLTPRTWGAITGAHVLLDLLTGPGSAASLNRSFRQFVVNDGEKNSSFFTSLTSLPAADCIGGSQ